MTITDTDRPAWELTPEVYEALVWVRDTKPLVGRHAENRTDDQRHALEELQERGLINWPGLRNEPYAVLPLGRAALALYEARQQIARQAPVVEAACEYVEMAQDDYLSLEQAVWTFLAAAPLCTVCRLPRPLTPHDIGDVCAECRQIVDAGVEGMRGE